MNQVLQVDSVFYIYIYQQIITYLVIILGSQRKNDDYRCSQAQYDKRCRQNNCDGTR